eukprot:CAMPEP_0119129802 /NCGR_PEP_ID=MMETSP1310-20130426/7393_1 /TAXON_ID=464262 /ORGANISM="Genus nov. species nov., Strain RCC2339" /LENGTH=746 /DNA_ID=CAMNT_0007120249 /DNA_START=65 /DNA_END=2305 /DNA_ORIENTATION=-
MAAASFFELEDLLIPPPSEDERLGLVFGASREDFNSFNNGIDLKVFPQTKLSFGGLQPGGAVDFNGGGQADLVVGLPTAQEERELRSVVRIRLLENGALENAQVDGDNSVGFTCGSTKVWGWVGATGDVNGDGIDDLGIAAFNGDSTTAVYVVFGNKDFSNGDQFDCDELIKAGKAWRIEQGKPFLLDGGDTSFNLSTESVWASSMSTGRLWEFNGFGKLAEWTPSIQPAGDANQDGTNDFVVSTFTSIEGDSETKREIHPRFDGFAVGSHCIVLGDDSGAEFITDVPSCIKSQRCVCFRGARSDFATNAGFAGRGGCKLDGDNEFVVLAATPTVVKNAEVESKAAGGVHLIKARPSLADDVAQSGNVARLEDFIGSGDGDDVTLMLPAPDVPSFGLIFPRVDCADINGDGVDDLVVAQTAYIKEGIAESRVYVLFGGSDFTDQLTPAGGSNTYVLEGDNVATLKISADNVPEVFPPVLSDFTVQGDANADGVNDLLMGFSVPSNTDGGSTFKAGSYGGAALLYGSDTFPTGTFTMDDFSDKRIFTNSVPTYGGVSVSFVEVNGDNAMDPAITAGRGRSDAKETKRQDEELLSDVGSVHVFLGEPEEIVELFCDCPELVVRCWRSITTSSGTVTQALRRSVATSAQEDPAPGGFEVDRWANKHASALRAAGKAVGRERLAKEAAGEMKRLTASVEQRWNVLRDTVTELCGDQSTPRCDALERSIAIIENSPGLTSSALTSSFMALQ